MCNCQRYLFGKSDFEALITNECKWNCLLHVPAFGVGRYEIFGRAEDEYDKFNRGSYIRRLRFQLSE